MGVALFVVLDRLKPGERIAFLDLTEALQQQVAAGRNVYFPDDSHWNAAGQETAAASLRPLLQARGL